MGAGIGWIDFSNEHRDRVMSVIDLLNSAGAVDELGIGTTRDSLADRLFPGVSTIQTRPKYFILVAQIFRSYQLMAKDTKRMPVLKDFLLSKEKALIDTLANNHGHQLGQGVIGITKAGTSSGLARYPSSVYWNGLRTHGIIETHESLAEYLRRNDLSEREADSVEGDDTLLENEFGIRLSNLPHYDEHVRLDLSSLEAGMLCDFFRDTYHGKKPEDNLLSLILSSEERMELVSQSPSFNPLAERLLKDAELPESIREVLRMAVLFDLLMHGAHIFYNLMLSSQFGTTSDNELKERWGNWIDEIEENLDQIANFNLDILFATVATNVNESTMSFIKAWKLQVLLGLNNHEDMAVLIRRQEVRIKGGRAKLVSKEFAYEGWVGISKLEYRFVQVKNIVTDIMQAHATS